MILKIGFKTGWVLYDGFEKVRYGHMPNSEAVKIDTDATWYGGKEDPNGNSILITARIAISGREFSIKTNNVVFLCNDEGKTIEKLN